MGILRYNEYSKSEEMALEFVNSFTPSINESSNKEEEYKSILQKVVKDLGLNFSFIGTFGTGVALMYPIVDELIKNSSFNVESTPETIILATITTFSIIYLEEKKSKLSEGEIESLKDDNKSLLTELKLRGVGNAIIKKLISCFNSITNIFKIIFKNTGHVISAFFDIFGYTALLIPAMNGIFYMIHKYDMNIDSMINNFLSLGLGVASLYAKHGINYLIDKLKNSINIKKMKLDEEPIIKNSPEFIDVEDDSVVKTINEYDG